VFANSLNDVQAYYAAIFQVDLKYLARQNVAIKCFFRLYRTIFGKKDNQSV